MPETTTEGPTVEERLAQLEQAVLELMDAPRPVPAEPRVAGEPEPTPGRVVLYHTGVQTFAAIVTHVYPSGSCALTVFGMGAPATIRDSVLRGEEGRSLANRWTWPPRAPLPEIAEEGEGGEA
jgi:hypothetical protein